MLKLLGRHRNKETPGVRFNEGCGCVSTAASRAERALEKAHELRFESPWRMG